MLKKITDAAGTWALWKGLDWAFQRYFSHCFGADEHLHPELARSTKGLSEEHLAALYELGRAGSPLRNVVEHILDQEYPSHEVAAEDLSRQIDALTRPEAEVLIALMLLGKSAQQD